MKIQTRGSFSPAHQEVNQSKMVFPKSSEPADWKKVSSVCLRSWWPGKDIRKLCSVHLPAIHCDSHKWQGKKDKGQARAESAALCSSPEKSGCLTVCVWTLPEPRSKSYGDKSPRDTQTPPFTTEGAYFWPAYLILSRWMQSTEQYFLIQRRNRSKR